MRLLEFAKRPQNQRQIRHDGAADILGKTSEETGIALRIKHRERAFKLGA